jgi:hypothetical protein
MLIIDRHLNCCALVCLKVAVLALGAAVVLGTAGPWEWALCLELL